DALGQLNPEHLKPSSELDARIKAGLAPIRPPALNIGVRPFDFTTVTCQAELELEETSEERKEQILRSAKVAVNHYLNPLTGGPDGTGWPFERTLHTGEIFRVLQLVPGVTRVAWVNLAENGNVVEPVELEASKLFIAGEHTISTAPA
ncbi:hypothetical protein OS965_42040, partial [Streptomyces sp. H27-G5]|nr:hypothetical protein [Streptomyces sp. H27-G5]